MTRDTAEKIVLALLAAVRAVNDNLLLLVQPEVSEAIYQEYRKRNGRDLPRSHETHCEGLPRSRSGPRGTRRETREALACAT